MKYKTKTITLPVELIEKITKFQEDRYFSSFSGAATEIIRLGLKNIEKEK